MTIGSLFSGIGGLELGLERAGLGPVVWQCEIDPFARRVLERHWPNVRRFEDVTRPRDWPHVDLVCGGFPCQDVSSAGKRRGLGGARSGLWYHFARIVRQVRPSWVVVENVASGARAWLPTVRRDLHVLGYDSAAIRLSAFDVGAPHLRRRIFVVASDAHGNRKHARAVDAKVAESSAIVADATRERGREGRSSVEGQERRSPWAEPEPDMVRMVHGLSDGLDSARRRALGNAVVPQCAEVIGRMIVGGMA